jgi:23S rRNA (adenine2503-C2)-methyltransferase
MKPSRLLLTALPLTSNFRKVSLLDFNYERLSSLFSSLGFPNYRVSQIFQAVLKHNTLVYSSLYTLSKKERDLLDETFLPLRRASIMSESTSKDGTIKWLVNVAGGDATKLKGLALLENINTINDEQISSIVKTLAVETVFIPEQKRGSGTLCVSSQSGCSLSCSFCHTGTQALGGNLPASSIIEQYLLAKSRLESLHQSRISHVVFMGQGEPLLNWRSVRTAIDTLTHPFGSHLPPRRITVSTAGVAPLISKVATETPGVRLAISLHAPNDKLRSTIMGINTQWSIQEVLKACQDYIDIRLSALADKKNNNESDDDKEDDTLEEKDENEALQTSNLSILYNERHNGAKRVRVTFEYVLLDGINDSDICAEDLAKLLHGSIRNATLFTHVNLIHFNEWPESIYKKSKEERMISFQNILLKNQIVATVRRSRGLDILGACGQLKSSTKSKC